MEYHEAITHTSGLYLGAVKHGNIFSIDLGPNYDGKLRDIDVQTLRKVGQMIKNPVPTIEEFRLFPPGAKPPENP